MRSLHTRIESDAILIYAGTLLEQCVFTFWHSSETGDWMNPCILPTHALISIGARETSAIVDFDQDALQPSGLDELPPLHWFPTSAEVASREMPKGVRTPTPVQSPVKESHGRANGSKDYAAPGDHGDPWGGSESSWVSGA